MSFFRSPRARRHAQLFAAIVSAAALTTACLKRDTFKPHEVKSLSEAGSTHISVLSVGRWDDYVDVLQPDFQLKAEQARGMVAPITMSMEERFIDAAQMALQIAGPTNSFARKKTVTTETTEQETATDEETPTETAGTTKTTTKNEATGEAKSGSVTNAPLPSDVDPGRTADKVGANAKTSGQVKLEPMMEYWNATALYQEVQLLNRYVRDASLRYGFEPYVVRLQVSITPFARNQPYDVYTTFSFFSSGDDGQGANAESKPGSKMQPQVIPLLVTDNLERSEHVRASNAIRQYAMGLSFMLESLEGRVGGGRFKEQLQSLVGQDYNSLMTLSRLSDNTMRARFGAMQQAEARYSMVPRTNVVTVLMLVPREQVDRTFPTVRMMARTSMVHATSGKELPLRSREELRKAMDRLVEVRNLYRYVAGIPARTECAGLHDAVACSSMSAACVDLLVGSLFQTVQADDYEAFETMTGCMITKDGYVPNRDALWVDLNSLAVGNGYVSASFDLPRAGGAVVPEAQPVLAIDDGKTTTITVRGGTGLMEGRTDATLFVAHQPGRTIPLLADKVQVKEGGRRIVLEFPSIRAHELISDASVPTMHLEIYAAEPGWRARYAAPGAAERPFRLARIAYMQKGAPKPPINNADKETAKLSTSTPSVAMLENHTGELELSVTLPKDVKSAVLAVEGALLDNVTSRTHGQATAREEGWQINQGGTGRLELSGLVAHAPVVVYLKDESGKKVLAQLSIPISD